MNRERWIVFAVLLLALVLPHGLRGSQTEFAIEVMTTAMFALSLNILIGRLGLISFGHGLFLGVGAYLAGLMLPHLTQNLFLLLAAALAVGAFVSLIVGLLVLRLGGVGFVMITIALCQLAYVAVLSADEWTGGINGIVDPAAGAVARQRAGVADAGQHQDLLPRRPGGTRAAAARCGAWTFADGCGFAGIRRTRRAWQPWAIRCGASS